MTEPDRSGHVADSDEAIRTSAEAQQESRAARLFDIRRIIGGLFIVYGVILVIAGFGDSKAEVAKAVGVRINVWTGIAMLALGLIFVAWALWRPVQLGPVDQQAQLGTGDGEGGGQRDSTAGLSTGEGTGARRID